MIEEIHDGVVVIGTAHVSPTSVATVEEEIRQRKPKKVLIELDQARHDAIQDPDRWQKTDIIDVIRQKKQHLFLVQLYLANMQARIGEETGTKPGAEMLKAIEVAKEVGAEVVLIDRDVGITLKRGFGAMGFWQRMGLAANFLLEMLPSGPPPEQVDPRKRFALGAGITAFLMLLIAYTTIGARFVSGSSNILDTLIGFPSLPALSVALGGALVGALLAWAQPPSLGKDATWWDRIQNIPLPALLLGLMVHWSWQASGRGAWLDVLVPGGPWPRPAMVGLALVLFVPAAWAGARAITGMRRFNERRAEAAAQGELDIDALLETDAVTAMTEEFARFAPGIKHSLIDERDAYMASHIHEHARDASVVAVVGAGHVPGIKRHLGQGTSDIDRHALDQLPPRRFGVGRLLAYAIPLAIIAAFAYAFYTGGAADLWENLRIWILINGTLSALGAMIALGHPISWVVAFIAAPITSLNPLLAAGWFAGLAEAKLRTPKVADFEAIPRLKTAREFWTNPVVRVLLVTALANVGSAIGTWIAGFQIVRNTVGT